MAAQVVEAALKDADMDVSSLDYLVLHQVNGRASPPCPAPSHSRAAAALSSACPTPQCDMRSC